MCVGTTQSMLKFKSSFPEYELGSVKNARQTCCWTKLLLAERDHLLLLCSLTVPLGDRLVQELVDAVDHVGPDKREAPEASAVHHSDRQWGTVHLLY